MNTEGVYLQIMGTVGMYKVNIIRKHDETRSRSKYRSSKHEMKTTTYTDCGYVEEYRKWNIVK